MAYTMWIYVVVILILSEAWGKEPGSNQNTSVITSTSPPKVHVHRNALFNQGRDVNLTCSERTWNETFYIIWEITLKNKICKISLNSDGGSEDSCNDGKSLRNTSSSQSYLRISKFSNNDVGVYKCQSPYRGGTVDVIINVNTTVLPTVTMWVEHEGNKTVAVCKAGRGNPAANISWSIAGNWSVDSVSTEDGLFTVESRLLLPEGTDAENINCVVRHSCWEGEKCFSLNHIQGNVLWLLILIVVIITVMVAGLLFIAQKKLRMLRQCQQSDPSSSKSPPTEDVEEVQPYASYVQRVNSIYNSSADLFT
ncbi:cell surface glycoprotein CD200 receptor 1-A isoform X2 [Labrus mixtus]|uniref:cell surface glycoprotein CD200 receptor 1-A isoform X2 n=1 Tax=Labrus mixtus TaxID=508554 RepID=UPI0029C003E9|nr:cell surface glycoprotein CD200 receptor 1-A isoform X2 [Labrus mixtus]